MLTASRSISAADSMSCILASILCLLSLGATPADSSPFPDLSAEPQAGIGTFRITTDSTASGQLVDYGIIILPESRTRPDSRTMQLPFVRYRATLDNTQPPVFLLTGGPGVSNLWVDLPGVSSEHGDLVKIGYRGVDGDVRLRCPEIGQAMTIAHPLSTAGRDSIRTAMRNCYSRLLQNDVDIDAFNMLEVVDDLEAIRDALGYSRINLFSTSYGTQLAYLYCARHPENAARSLMIGASSRGRQFVYDPAMIERQLAAYNATWQSDAEAVARSSDIVRTMRLVQSTLPPQWRGIPLDLDKLKMVTYYLLYETGTAAMLFDAYVAAENGDPSGLALLCLGWDDEATDSTRRYWGDFVSKIVSGRSSAWRNGNPVEIPEDAAAVCALSRLWWDCAGSDGWPIRALADEYCRLDTVNTEILMVNGSLDFSSPPDYLGDELLPCMPNGHVAVIANMGHMDVIRLQRGAFEHMVGRFYREGVVDTSQYVPHRIDFTPPETYTGYARQLFPEGQ